jgi:hypothetical protein
MKTADVQTLKDCIEAISMTLSTLPLGSTNPGSITPVLKELKSNITIANLTANAIIKNAKAIRPQSS